MITFITLALACLLGFGLLVLAAFLSCILALVTLAVSGALHTLLCFATGRDRDEYPELLPLVHFGVFWIGWMAATVVCFIWWYLKS